MLCCYTIILEHHLTQKCIFATFKSFLLPLFLMKVGQRLFNIATLQECWNKNYSKSLATTHWRTHSFIHTLSSDPWVTNRAFNILLPFSFCFSVKNQLHETLSWPWSWPQLNTSLSFKLFNSLSLASKTSWLFPLTTDNKNICFDWISSHDKTSSQLTLLRSSLPTISMFY